MKKVIGIIVLVIAIVLIVLGLKTQETPENVAVVEDTNVEDTDNSEDNAEDEVEGQEPEVNEEEVGTELPVAEESTNNTTEEDTEGATIYTVENNSQILWFAKKVGGQHNGYVNILNGTILEKEGRIVGGEITFDTTSIKATDVDNEGLDNHLKSEEYFNVEEYPIAELNIKNIEEGETIVTADLTLNGTTKTIAFPANIETTDTSISVNANFALDRTMRNINGGLPAVSKYMEITLENLTFNQQ